MRSTRSRVSANPQLELELDQCRGFEAITHHSTLSRTLLRLEEDGFVLTAARAKLIRSGKLPVKKEEEKSQRNETI